MEDIGTTIKEKNLDFADVSRCSSECYAKLSDMQKAVTALDETAKFAKTKSDLVGIIRDSMDLMEDVKDCCDQWQTANFRKLELKIASIKQVAESTFTTWPTSSMRVRQPQLASLNTIPTQFNKMRNARKQTATPSIFPTMMSIPISRDSLPAAGWVQVMTPSRPNLEVWYSPNANDYFRSMQSLLKAYKGLRGDLDEYIERAKKQGWVYGSAYSQFYDRAYESRQNIYNAMNGLPISHGFGAQHQEALNCVLRGLNAMDALKAGDYSTFHNLSTINTNALRRVMNEYDLRG